MKKLRLYAFSIDLLITSVIFNLVMMSYSSYINSTFGPKAVKLLKNQHLIQPLTAFCIFMTYFCLSFYMGHGQTLGQRVMGLATIRNNYFNKFNNNHFAPSLVQSFRKSLGLLFTTLSMGLLFWLADKKGRSFSDYYSHTTVLKTEELYHLFLKHQESIQIVIDLDALAIQTYQEEQKAA